ncbi:MAG: BppU family phage baseplate upper protein, partial [Staphylococcus equorum]|nr:BppU family phage baseplate upper protein [Staphylococcus equorum]
MTINKNTDLEFSLQQKTEKGGVYTNFYTGDKGSASIRIRLSSDESYLDLTKIDLKPVLFLFHEDGSIFEIKDFINVMSDKGLIQYNISDNVIAHAGRIKAKLFLRNAEQSVHMANFTFDIKDSGIDGAVAKEISVNIIDDTVRRIVKENAIEILGDGFEESLNTDVINHLDSNPDLFKGDKGDTGEQGPQGEKGVKGDKGDHGAMGYKGERFRFEDFTPEQLDSLRTHIVPGEKETKIVDKGIEDSFIAYPPNGEDFRIYPDTIGDEYFHSGTIKNTTPTNSVNADSSFKIDSGGYLFYAVKTKNELAPGNKFSIKVEVETKDSGLSLEYGILDSEGGYIEYITPLEQLSANTYGLEEYVIPEGADAIQFRVDARQSTSTSSIKSFYIFSGKATKEGLVATDEDVLKGVLEEIDKLKLSNKDDEEALTGIFEEIDRLKLSNKDDE